MKYIVIGLGYFGTSLATKLTTLGHEVIGVDNLSERADELKDRITKVIIMDSTKQSSLESLPLSDVDAILVTIGEDIGSSILTLSMLKKMKVKRLIGRAINPVHHNILKELGIEEIVHPEEDTAELVTDLLMIRNAINILPVNDRFIIAEMAVPKRYADHNLDTINLEMRFNIKPIAVKIAPKEKGIKKLIKKDFQVDMSCDRERLLNENDRLLLIGEIDSFKRFIE
jgi:trk system potassium uptake protein TrkA